MNYKNVEWPEIQFFMDSDRYNECIAGTDGSYLVPADLYNEVKYKYDYMKNDDSTTAFKAITEKMYDTYVKKNHDYGNSFDKSLDKFGIVAALVRMGDKMNRIESLATSENKVKDESINDTLLDLANYAIMTLIWKQNQK